MAGLSPLVASAHWPLYNRRPRLSKLRVPIANGSSIVGNWEVLNRGYGWQSHPKGKRYEPVPVRIKRLDMSLQLSGASQTFRLPMQSPAFPLSSPCSVYRKIPVIFNNSLHS